MAQVSRRYKVTHYGFSTTSRTISAPSPRQAVTKTYGSMGGGITAKSHGLITDFLFNNFLRFRVHFIGERQ